MSQENTEIQNQSSDRTFTQAEVEEAIKKRVEAANRLREEERRAHEEKMKEMERKMLEMQQKNKQESGEPAASAAANNASNDAYYDNMISQDELPQILAMEQKKQELQKKLNQAEQEDPEFAELVKKGNPIPGPIVSAVGELDNGPALLKHLLKDKRDHQLMMAAAQSTPYEWQKFLIDLTDKVDANIKKPHASEYEEVPDMRHMGETGDDFDMQSYVKKKVGKSR